MTPAPCISPGTLGATDMKSARGFYAALGRLEAAASRNALAFFQPPERVLPLFPREPLATEMNRCALPEGSESVTPTHDPGSATDVDTRLAAMVPIEAAPIRAPSFASDGRYAGNIAAYCGHAGELAHVETLSLAAHGSLTVPCLAS